MVLYWAIYYTIRPFGVSVWVLFYVSIPNMLPEWAILSPLSDNYLPNIGANMGYFYKCTNLSPIRLREWANYWF